MILKFSVEYNTETKRFMVDGVSDNVEVKHSGSSYLRINADGIYGTIGCLNPRMWNPKWNSETDDNGKSSYLQFEIMEIDKEESL